MTSKIVVNNIEPDAGISTVSILGIATATNFKTGTTNVHNVGVELAGINVLGADTPIGTGSTIYDDGGARFSGVVTATSFSGSGANLTGINADLVNDTSPQLGGNLDVNTKNIVFGDSSDGSSDDVLVFGSGTDMKVFHDGSNTKFKNSAGRIHIENSAGPIRTQTDHGFFMMSNDGNTVHAEVDSDGLKFNGDTAAANALDDYEEGSYTANFEVTSGSANFHNNTLHYVKIGSMCYVHGEIGTNSKSSPGGDLRFDLPFTAKASGSNMDGHARGLVGAIWNYYGTSNPYGNYGWYPLHIQLTSGAANNVILYIVGYNSQNSNWGPIGNLIGSGAQIGLSFTYRTA